MSNVLISDALLRKSLTATRSLGSRQLRVYTADKSRLTPSSFSKFSTRSLRSPDPLIEPNEYWLWLKETIQLYRIDVFFPMDDGTLGIALAHRDELEKICHCVLPTDDSYRIASDKYSTVTLAVNTGVPCPKTWMPEDSNHLAEWLEQFSFPMVIKPRFSSGSRGIRIVNNKAQLIDEYNEIHTLYPNPLVQEFIPQGERFDVCLLYDKHNQIRCSFVQREIRHFPLDIGPSTVQESVWMPELIEQAKKLLSGIKWCGIIEIEFMRDPRDKVLKLMEINPRFWNSLHLAVQSGVDFPFLLYQLAMDREVPEINNYAVGQICRNLLPGDLLHFLVNKNRKHMNPPLFSRNGLPIEDDIWSKKDPLAAIGFAAACIQNSLNWNMWKKMFVR
jgi:predicted ATP-grasp superfamily ATP-dependent carboligase